jgi:UDP-N-acetylmuramyl pentapeptide phosphotransferase/UDP-N-acetylglucosamine-1-phosphate transferase
VIGIDAAMDGRGLPLLLAVALLTALLTEAWRRWALERGVLDIPGTRSSHAQPVPRGGGVAIATAILLGVGWFDLGSDTGSGVLASIALAAMIGLMDDLSPLRPRWKLAGQVVAAAPLAWAVPLDPALLPAGLPAGLGHGASLALAVLFMNAWNFMDGINGIAALSAAVVGLVASVAALGGVGGAPVLAAVLAAACLGFLPFNAPRARVFMGDCGSHALGMSLAALLLLSSAPAMSAVVIAAASPFLVDVLGTLARRALDGEPLATAHRRHLYQLVTRTGYSHARATSAYALWMAVNGAVVAMVEGVAGRGMAAAAAVIAASAAGWLVLSSRLERRLRAGGLG